MIAVSLLLGGASCFTWFYLFDHNRLPRPIVEVLFWLSPWTFVGWLAAGAMAFVWYKVLMALVGIQSATG